MLSRNEFLEMAKNKMKRWNSDIDVLEHRIQHYHYKEISKTNYERILCDIRQRQTEATNKINEIKREGEEHWHSLNDQADQLMNALDKSIKRFKSKIK